MKKLIAAAVFFVLGYQVVEGSLRWGNGSSVILDYDGTPVPTSSEEVPPNIPLDPTIGAFAQLIRIVVGTDPYTFVNSGSGISVGNEVVVQTMYSGQYDDLLETAGAFSYSDTPFLNNSVFNGVYYVRVFNSAQASAGAFNLGTAAPIPEGATHYFESSVYNYTHNELAPSVFDFGAGQALNVVPEPGTIVLVAAGMGLLALRRKRLV